MRPWTHAALATLLVFLGGCDTSASGPDGASERLACTNDFGTGISSGYGRLDGVVVAVVPPSQHGCRSDSDHVHLQVLMSGDTYDVAVNVHSNRGSDRDIRIAEKDADLADGWSEGWHSGAKLDYAADLGLHDGDFRKLSEDDAVKWLEDALANANHVSIFGTGYSGGDGAHLIHRNDGKDGAVVVSPTEKPHYLAFHFADQSF